MRSLDNLLTELSKLPDVSAVAAADDTGSYLAGIDVDDADEFAAVLAFIGRSGAALEDALGLDQLNFISLSGKKNKLIVHKIEDQYVGIRLKDTAVASKLEPTITKLVRQVNLEEG